MQRCKFRILAISTVSTGFYESRLRQCSMLSTLYASNEPCESRLQGKRLEKIIRIAFALQLRVFLQYSSNDGESMIHYIRCANVLGQLHPIVTQLIINTFIQIKNLLHLYNVANKMEMNAIQKQKLSGVESKNWRTSSSSRVWLLEVLSRMWSLLETDLESIEGEPTARTQLISFLHGRRCKMGLLFFRQLMRDPAIHLFHFHIFLFQNGDSSQDKM